MAVGELVAAVPLVYCYLQRNFDSASEFRGLVLEQVEREAMVEQEAMMEREAMVEREALVERAVAAEQGETVGEKEALVGATDTSLQ